MVPFTVRHLCLGIVFPRGKYKVLELIKKVRRYQLRIHLYFLAGLEKENGTIHRSKP